MDVPYMLVHKNAHKHTTPIIINYRKHLRDKEKARKGNPGTESEGLD